MAALSVVLSLQLQFSLKPKPKRLRYLKFASLRLLALGTAAIVALSAQSVVADDDFISTCDIECNGPLTACSWETMNGKTTMADCNRENEKCLKDCYAKNGHVKYVYKPSPHPEAVDTPEPTTMKPKTKKPKTKEPKTKKPSNDMRGADDDESEN